LEGTPEHNFQIKSAVNFAELDIKTLKEFIKAEGLEYLTAQKKLCFVIIARIYRRVLAGYYFGPIAIDEDLIVNGNHRYIAYRLANVKFEVVKATRSHCDQLKSFSDIAIDIEEDWDANHPNTQKYVPMNSLKEEVIKDVKKHEMKFFLDIDGVMVHANPHRKVEMEEDGFYKFNSVAVQVLKSVLMTTKDELILSTSHRFRYNLRQWRAIFRARGLSMKKISILNLPLETKSNRRLEIMQWIIEKHLEPSDLVIIDDDKSLNELPVYLKDRFVLTNSYIGLNEDTDLHRIVNRPSKRLSPSK